MTHAQGLANDFADYSYVITELDDPQKGLYLEIQEYIINGFQSPKSIDIEMDFNERQELNDYRKSFVKCIKTLGRLDSSNPRYLEIIRDLQQAGFMLYKKLFKKALQIPAHADLLSRLFDRTPKGQPGRVKIVSNGFYIDYQFLCSNNTGGPECFLGRKYIFNRQFRNQIADSEIGPIPNLSYIHYRNSKFFADNEFRVLDDLNLKQKIKLKHPEDTKTAKEIILSDEYDLLYLSCHVRSSKEPGGDPPHMDFGSERIDFYKLNGPALSKSKMAFINACESGPVGYDLEFSFTRHFISELGFASVLGVHFNVTKSFAGQFGANVLRELLLPDVGEDQGIIDYAIFKASEKFIEQGHWGGLFYSVYGHSYLNN